MESEIRNLTSNISRTSENFNTIYGAIITMELNSKLKITNPDEKLTSLIKERVLQSSLQNKYIFEKWRY